MINICLRFLNDLPVRHFYFEFARPLSPLLVCVHVSGIQTFVFGHCGEFVLCLFWKFQEVHVCVFGPFLTRTHDCLLLNESVFGFVPAWNEPRLQNKVNKTR